jgi:pyruvate formate lyase activating enzyme
MNKEVPFYEKKDGFVQCRMCPHYCRIKPLYTGICRVRQNLAGTLYATNYGDCVSVAMDPIEKKPLYHFHPGSVILSLGIRGCNLKCSFCQNWQLVYGNDKGIEMTPEQVVDLALRHRDSGCVGIAYTYSEPFMWYEFVYDTARLAYEAGIKNVLVTNGYVNEEPLREILPYIDAMNIDVKAFTDEFYRENCIGHLEPVLNTVKIASKECHVEITTLIIPTLNDSTDEIGRLVDWIASVDPEIPFHLSGYFPNFQMDIYSTPESTIRHAREIALQKLKFVYLGNIIDRDGSTTYCPNCSKPVLSRTGFYTESVNVKQGKCGYCGSDLNMVV